MKRLNEIEKIARKKRIVLGLESPKYFNDYRILSKKIFLKEKELFNLKKYNFEFIDFENLIIHCKEELNEVLKQTKSKFPTQYYITSLIDVVLGKRKL